MATEKQKANLIPFTTEQSREQAKINGRKGGKASGVARTEKKTLRQLAEIALAAKIHDDKIKEQLEMYGLPATLGGKTIFNAIQKAGLNSHMLRTILELTGDINQQNNVTVNAVPIIIGGENELK